MCNFGNTAVKQILKYESITKFDLREENSPRGTRTSNCYSKDL